MYTKEEIQISHVHIAVCYIWSSGWAQWERCGNECWVIKDHIHRLIICAVVRVFVQWAERFESALSLGLGLLVSICILQSRSMYYTVVNNNLQRNVPSRLLVEEKVLLQAEQSQIHKTCTAGTIRVELLKGGQKAEMSANALSVCTQDFLVRCKL